MLLNGVADGARTRDLRDHNPMLSLSYSRMLNTAKTYDCHRGMVITALVYKVV